MCDVVELFLETLRFSNYYTVNDTDLRRYWKQNYRVSVQVKSNIILFSDNYSC